MTRDLCRAAGRWSQSPQSSHRCSPCQVAEDSLQPPRFLAAMMDSSLALTSLNPLSLSLARTQAHSVSLCLPWLVSQQCKGVFFHKERRRSGTSIGEKKEEKELLGQFLFCEMEPHGLFYSVKNHLDLAAAAACSDVISPMVFERIFFS